MFWGYVQVTGRIDALHGRMLALRRQDGRAPASAPAAELGVAQGVVPSRLARLRATGIMRHLAVEVDAAALAARVRTIMRIVLQTAMGRAVIRVIRRRY